ncbi:MAG: TonB-dependent receptor [Chromatiaceae bacterium]|nr:MAG: TonB-dependent receptor [Chromatiaceae bacterium]
MSHIPLSQVLAACLPMLGATAAAADPNLPLELDALVVSATLTETNPLDAPGSVQVISAQQMRERNARTVAEALEAATGVALVRESGRVVAASIRGARSKHSLILLDGRRLALGFNDQIDLRQLPTAMVERIEIVRGPSSALYGSDALGGVINIISRQPPPTTAGQVDAQYGIDRRGEGGAGLLGVQVGGPVESSLRVLVGGEWHRQNPWDLSGVLPDDGDREEAGNAAGRFHFDLAPGHHLAGGLEYLENRYRGDRLFEQLHRQRQADESRLGYFLRYDAALTGDHRVELLLNRSEYSSNLSFMPFAASGDRRLEQDVDQVDLRYTGRFGQRQLVTLGGQWREDGLVDRVDRDQTTAAVTTRGVYLQNEIDLFDSLYAVLGVRYDHHGQFGAHWSPRAALVWSLSDRLRLKAAYGEGFRAPSLTELFVTSLRRRGREVYLPNTDLQPETSNSFELGLTGEFGRGYGSLTVFRNDIEDLIEAVFIGSEGRGNARRDLFQFRNVANARRQGVEVEGGVTLPAGFSATGNLAWVDIESGQAGQEFGAQPAYKGFLQLSYADPPRRLRANVRVDYVGELRYADGFEQSYVTVGTRVSKGLGTSAGGGLELFAGIENLLDERVERGGVVQVEPTTFYAGATLTF